MVGDGKAVGRICHLIGTRHVGSRQGPKFAGPVDQRRARTTAGRCHPTNKNLVVAAREYVLQGAVEPAETPVDDRRAGLLDVGRNGRETSRLGLPTCGREVTCNLLLITGEHADCECFDRAYVPNQLTGSVDGHGDQERIQRQRGKGGNRHSVRAFRGFRRNHSHARGEPSRGLPEGMPGISAHMTLGSEPSVMWSRN